MSEGVICCGRPLGPRVGVGAGRAGETGGKCRRGVCAAARLRGRLLSGETEAASYFPLPLCLAVTSPSLEEEENDIGPKFGEVCFFSHLMRPLSRRERQHVGALIGVS